MNPAISVVFFTCLAGAAQGLVVALAATQLAGVTISGSFLSNSLLLALVLLLAGLASSFLHLGHPERAWRAVMMWRTSWLSREVIALPCFIAAVALWWALPASPALSTLLSVLVILLAALLWYCTAMIYACLRFIQEWAHPLTIVNYTLIGLSSGLVLACALASAAGESRLLAIYGPAALLFTVAAALTRSLSLKRNDNLRPKSTLQSATGLKATQIQQKSMGMSAGAFNTREFFHGKTLAFLKQTRAFFLIFTFALPILALVWGITSGPGTVWWLALMAQIPGVLMERWYFFAQARHPQNLYYQVVS